MKKSIFFAALAFVTVAFMGCKSNQTPTSDTTKLWPAVNGTGDYFGFIDQNGQFVIQPTYDDVSEFSCGYAYARVGRTEMYLDKKGNAQTTLPAHDEIDYYFYYKCARYWFNNMVGMMNTSMKTCIQPAYAKLGYMSAEGLSWFLQPGATKYGFINKNGEIKLQATYNGVGTFEDGVAVVQLGDKCGAIDTKGQYKVPIMYDYLLSVGEGRLIFADYSTEKGGMIDTKGNVIVPAMYDDYKPFADNGLMPVKRNDKWGYCDKDGKEVIPFQYDMCYSFYGGYAWARLTKNSVYQLIDTKGNIVLSLAKDEVPDTNFHNGLACVCSPTNTGYAFKYIDVNGKTIYSWSVKRSTAPARCAMADQELTNAKLFAGTEFGPRFQKDFSTIEKK